MADEADIVTAFMDRMATLGAIPVAWPNGDMDAATLPRYEVAIGPVAQIRRGVSPVSRADQMFQVTAVVGSGGYAGSALNMAVDVASHYPMDALIGSSTVEARPVIGPALQEESEYRIPVTIRLRYFLE